MSAWKRMRFRKKLIVSYLTVFLIAVLLIVFYTASVSRQTIYDNNVGTVRGMAEALTQRFVFHTASPYLVRFIFSVISFSRKRITEA